MIVFVPLVYAFLSSGGYLNNIGSIQDFLQSFQNDNGTIQTSGLSEKPVSDSLQTYWENFNIRSIIQNTLNNYQNEDVEETAKPKETQDRFGGYLADFGSFIQKFQYKEEAKKPPKLKQTAKLLSNIHRTVNQKQVSRLRHFNTEITTRHPFKTRGRSRGRGSYTIKEYPIIRSQSIPLSSVTTTTQTENVTENVLEVNNDTLHQKESLPGSIQDVLQSFQNNNGTIQASRLSEKPVSDNLQTYWENFHIRNIIQNTINNYKNEDVEETAKLKETPDRFGGYLADFGSFIQKFRNKEKTTEPPKFKQTAKLLSNVHRTLNPKQVSRMRHFNTEITTRHPFKTRRRSRGRGSYTIKKYPTIRSQSIPQSTVTTTIQTENVTENVLKVNYDTIYQKENLPGPQRTRVLPLFHSFTGCDTDSFFNGKGKKSAFEAWEAFPTLTEGFILAIEGQIEEAMAIVEKYVIILYDRSNSGSSVNECRKFLFTKKDRQLKHIPPTKAALYQHFLRAIFQGVHVFGQLSATQRLPNSTDWGWTKMNDSWQPTWTDLPVAAKACQEMIRCKCKKQCGSRCSCQKRQLKCTEYVPSQSVHVTKNVEVCPDEGYFFKKNMQGRSNDSCYLCFCKVNSTEAVCWIRDYKKCDAETHYHTWGKRRIRRSPLSFGNLFFGNAARDALNANGRPEQCKPGEASYSEGCPPDDWCVGCTVCDCNVHGKWDCHLLSFCSEEDNKRKKAKQATAPGQPGYDPFKSRKSQKVERQKKKQVVQQIAEKMAQARQKKKIGKSNRKKFFFKNGTLVNKTIFDTRKRKKSSNFFNLTSAEVDRWSKYNLKIRKIPDQIQKQMMIDKQLNNAKKVSQVANFKVRNMLDQKQKQKLDQKKAQDVAKLAKRQPAKKKKKRNILLPSGVKIPKELLDKLPPGLIPTRDPPGAHYPKKVSIKRTQLNEMVAQKPVREMFAENPATEMIPKKRIYKRYAPHRVKPKRIREAPVKQNITKKNVKPIKESRKQGDPKLHGEKIKKMQKTQGPTKVIKTKQKIVSDEHFKNRRKKSQNIISINKKNTTKGLSTSRKSNDDKKKQVKKTVPKRVAKSVTSKKENKSKQKTKIPSKNLSKSNLRKNIPKKTDTHQQDKNIKKNTSNKKELILKNSKAKPSVKPDQIKNKSGKPTKKPPKPLRKNDSVIKAKEKKKKSISQQVTKKAISKTGPKQNEVPSKQSEHHVNRVKKSVMPKPNPKIDRTKINAEVQKLTKNIEKNLKRKVFQAVEGMIGQSLKGKREKRSVDFVNNIAYSTQPTENNLQKFSSKVSSNKNRIIAIMNNSFINNVSLKNSVPEITKSEVIRVKRSPQVNQKRVNEEVKKLTENIHANLRRKAIEAVEKMLNRPVTEETPKTKRSAPFLKEVLFKKKVKKDGNKKLLEIPMKKSQKLNVNKTNKVKISRHKRSVKNDENTNEKITLGDIEREISSNVKREGSSSMNDFGTKYSEMGYYNYDIDNDNAEKQSPGPKKRNYLAEVIEVYTKNSAAKRSVDSQIQNSNKLNVLQIVPNNTNDTGLKEQKLELTANNPVVIKPHVNLTIGTEDVIKSSLKVTGIEKATVNPRNKDDITEDSYENKIKPIKSNLIKSLNVLNDKVVIIHDQNISSIEGLDHLNDEKAGLKPSPTIATFTQDLESLYLINSSVISLQKQKQSHTDKFTKTDDIYITKSDSFDNLYSNKKIDKTVVVVKDQIVDHTTSFGMTKDSIVTTELYVQPKVQNTEVGVNQKTSSVYNFENNQKPSDREEPESPVTLSYLNNTSYAEIIERQTSHPKYFKNNNNTSEENIEIIRETIKPPQGTEEVKEKINNKYLLKLTTENYFKSQYNIEDHTTKQGHNNRKASEENKIEASQSKLTTMELTTEQNKDNSSSPNLNLTYNSNYAVNKRVSSPHLNLTTTKAFDAKIKQQNSKSSVEDSSRIENSAFAQKTLTASNEDILISTTTDNIVFTKITEPEIDYLPFMNTKRFDSTTNSEMKSSYNTDATGITNTIDVNNIDKSRPEGNINKLNPTILVTDRAYKMTENIAITTEKSKDYENQLSSRKKQITTYDIKKINLKKAKKLKVKKILTTLLNKTRKGDKVFAKNDNKFQKPGNKTNDLKSFFKKLLKGFKFRKGAHKSSKVKRFKILKYLQKFFKKIFAAEGKHKKNKTITPKLNRRSVIETLCSTFGPCNINIKNKAKLQNQVDHLNIETYKMLRSVKIIKGLLKLVDVERSYIGIDNTFNRTKHNFKNDVQKLHAILKDTYSQEENFRNLSETQKTQIEYIKNNTQNFIQSAAKFTMVLNDIIDLITVPPKTTENTTLNKLKSVMKQTIEDNQPKDTNKTLNNPNEVLDKLKDLISKYSLVQNTFMHKIYNILTRLDGKESKKIKNSFNTPKRGTNVTVQNKTEEIQLYTKNIIQNLRKLKNLAQNLSGNVRRKRNARSEDSIEYMLMLMEYLLKQNNQVEVAPAHDGIDLLLDAIKNAPDIKTVKNKVAQTYTSNQLKDKNATEVARKIQNNNSATKEENSSDSDSKPSKEDNSNSKSATFEESNLNTIAQSADNDDDDDWEGNMVNRRMVAVANQYRSTTVRAAIIVPETSTKYVHPDIAPASSDVEGLKPNLIMNSNENDGTETKLENLEKDVEDKRKQHPSSMGLVNHESKIYMTDGSYITSATEPAPVIKEDNLQAKRMNSNIKNEDDVSSSKSRLDWLDETYEEEIKGDSKNPSSPRPCQEGTQYMNGNCLEITTRSTNDDSEESKENKIQKVSRKKEMDLLNSLDYGSGKRDVSSSERDGSSESVENKVENGSIDKYSGDMFFFPEDKLM